MLEVVPMSRPRTQVIGGNLSGAVGKVKAKETSSRTAAKPSRAGIVCRVSSGPRSRLGLRPSGMTCLGRALRDDGERGRSADRVHHIHEAGDAAGFHGFQVLPSTLKWVPM